MNTQNPHSASHDAAYTAVAALSGKHLRVATAESCTGGLIAKLLTDVSGSSAVFEAGIAAYSDKAKTDVLGISPEILEKFGSVSEETASAMAKAAHKLCSVDIAVSAVGYAGPAGGTESAPVGTVCVAVASERYSEAVKLRLNAGIGRDAIRYAAAEAALRLIVKATQFYR